MVLNSALAKKIKTRRHVDQHDRIIQTKFDATKIPIELFVVVLFLRANYVLSWGSTASTSLFYLGP